jgi:hypothetical protein
MIHPSSFIPHPFPPRVPAMMRFAFTLLTIAILANAARAQDLSFEKSVLPIFEAKCLRCHGEKKQKAMLDLRTKAGLLEGGETGAALKPGSLKESLLWEKIRTDQMPEGDVKLTDEIKAHESKRQTFAEIRAFYDLPGEAKTHLLRRRDYLQPGPEVTPNVLGVLANAKAFALPVRPKDAKSIGRRLAFAKWLTRSDHPLTARVMVNRLWLHHFGLVAKSSLASAAVSAASSSPPC